MSNTEMTTFRLSNKHSVIKSMQDLKLITEENWTMTRLINESVRFFLKEKYGIEVGEY